VEKKAADKIKREGNFILFIERFRRLKYKYRAVADNFLSILLKNVNFL